MWFYSSSRIIGMSDSTCCSSRKLSIVFMISFGSLLITVSWIDVISIIFCFIVSSSVVLLVQSIVGMLLAGVSIGLALLSNRFLVIHSLYHISFWHGVVLGLYAMWSVQL